MCVSILMTSLLQKAIDVDTSVFLAVNGEDVLRFGLCRSAQL
jgi:hypothetical protein